MEEEGSGEKIQPISLVETVWNVLAEGNYIENPICGTISVWSLLIAQLHKIVATIFLFFNKATDSNSDEKKIKFVPFFSQNSADTNDSTHRGTEGDMWLQASLGLLKRIGCSTLGGFNAGAIYKRNTGLCEMARNRFKLPKFL